MKLIRRVERMEVAEMTNEKICLADRLKLAREKCLREGPRPIKAKEELAEMIAAGGLIERIARGYLRVIADKSARI